jgi:Tfp pilus assembly protein PilE
MENQTNQEQIKRPKHKFTIIEILLFVAVLIIIASIILISFKAVLKNKNAEQKTDLEEIKKAIELYHKDTGKYPANPNANEWCEIKSSDCLKEIIPKYLPSKPTTQNNGYYWFNYGDYRMLSTYLDPAEKGPGKRGWHCSWEQKEPFPYCIEW